MNKRLHGTQNKLKMRKVRDDNDELLAVLSQANAILYDGYEMALVGHSVGSNPRAVYDVSAMVDIHINRDNMTYDEAWEHLEFNAFSTAHPTNENKAPIFLYPYH